MEIEDMIECLYINLAHNQEKWDKKFAEGYEYAIIDLEDMVPVE